MVVTPCGPSGLNVARAVMEEQGYEKEPAPIHRQQEMARAVHIWGNPRKRKNAMKTRALIVSNHAEKILSSLQYLYSLGHLNNGSVLLKATLLGHRNYYQSFWSADD